MMKKCFLFAALLAAYYTGAATVAERIENIGKSAEILRMKDPLMSIWLSRQPGILKRLQTQIKADIAAGNSIRAAISQNDFDFLLNRVEKEVEWVKTSPEFDSKRINVRDLGAKGDGKTDDTVAIQKAIAMANNGKVRTVFLPKGRYRILHKKELMPQLIPGDVTGSWPSDHPSGALMIQAKNIRIQGEPGTELLVVDPQSSALAIIDSENVQISDLAINYEQPISICGVVTAVQKPDTMEIEFTEPGNPEADYFRKRAFKGLFRFHAAEVLPGTNRPANSNAVPHQYNVNFTHLGGRKYRIKCKNFLPLSDNYKPGMHFVYYARSWRDSAIFNQNSSHTRLERIRLSESPSIAFVHAEADMPLVANCSVEPLSGRWVSSAADGLYIRNGFGGLFYRNRIVNIGDDFINIHGRMNPIQKRNGNELYFIGDGWLESVLKRVTRAAIIRYGKGENFITAEIPVKSVEILPPMPKQQWKTVKVTLASDPGELLTVEGTKNKKGADCLFFPEREWQGMIIQENFFHHGISRLMIGGRNIDIVDNVIDDSLYNACLFNISQFHHLEVHQPFNVKIAGNWINSRAKTLFDFNSPIKPKAGAKPPKALFSCNFIEISNNRINMYSNWFLPPFRLQHGSNVQVKDNIIESTGLFSTPVFRCQAPLSAEIKDNVITGRFKGLFENNANQNVIQKNNILR